MSDDEREAREAAVREALGLGERDCRTLVWLLDHPDDDEPGEDAYRETIHEDE